MSSVYCFFGTWNSNIYLDINTPPVTKWYVKNRRKLLSNTSAEQKFRVKVLDLIFFTVLEELRLIILTVQDEQLTAAISRFNVGRPTATIQATETPALRS